MKKINQFCICTFILMIFSACDKKVKINKNNQSMKAIGYKETLSYLDKKINRDDLLALITTSTQQLAKRQITWKNKFKINYHIDYPDYEYIKLKDYIANILN